MVAGLLYLGGPVRTTASSLEQALACPGSTSLPTIDQSDSTEANEGTLVHEYLERVTEEIRHIDRSKYPAWCSRIVVEWVQT